MDNEAMQELKDELGANSYYEWQEAPYQEAKWFLSTDNGTISFDNALLAYRHLEKERQFAAMKALLEEEIEWVFAPQEITGLFALNAIAAIHLMNVVEKAKKILGSGE